MESGRYQGRSQDPPQGGAKIFFIYKIGVFSVDFLLIFGPQGGGAIAQNAPPPFATCLVAILLKLVHLELCHLCYQRNYFLHYYKGSIVIILLCLHL